MKSTTNLVPPARVAYPGLATAPWQAVRMPVTSDRNKFSTYYLACYVFLLSSLSYQILLSYGGVQLPVVATSYVVLFLIFLFTGQPFRFASSPLIYPWIGMIVWWMIAGAFGDYPRRSVTYLAEYAFRIHLLPFIFCTLLLSLRRVRTVLYGAGLGLPVLLLFCTWLGVIVESRLLIPKTSFANANDLALDLLLYGSLFLVFFKAGKLGRLLAIVVTPINMYFILKTGSRAAVITLGAILVLAFFILPLKKKLLLLVAVVLALGCTPLLPRQTLERLQTYFSVSLADSSIAAMDPTEEFRLVQAADSTRARLELQRRAIELTLAHPVLGIGPLNFEDAVEKMVQEKEKRRSGWQVAHNSYLQVSSETGIPGLLFYAWTIFLCLRLNYRAFRFGMREPEHRATTLQSFSLWLATLSYAVGVLFCSIAYDYYLPLLVAFTAANHLALQQAKEQSKPKEAAAPKLPDKRYPMPLKPSLR